MFSWPFIVAIVAIIGGLFYSAYEKHVELKLEEAKSRKSEGDEATKQELLKLKERVAVLEKIVTDKKYSLKDEIDSLDRAS